MKRSFTGDLILATGEEDNNNNNNNNSDDYKMKKKMKFEDQTDEIEHGFDLLDENLLYEVLKHADAKTLATSACVSRQWKKTARDERLWELICTKHWVNIGCGNQQLRSVVLALGGFRRLHSLYLLPLSKPSSSPAPAPESAWPVNNPFGQMMAGKPPKRWSKDEVHLSLSLLSIRYYEKMNSNKR